MKKIPNKTLLQVFSKLLSRLTELELYHDVIHYDKVPVLTYSIKEIETVIFDFPPKEAIKSVDNCLAKVLKLQLQEDSIIESVTVEEFNMELGEYISATEEHKEEAKREYLDAIQAELTFYNAKLTNLKESLLLNNSIEVSTQKTKAIQYNSISPNELALDMRQFALLFSYLRDQKVIQPLPDTKLAPYLSILSGFQTKIRSNKGLGAIPKIKSDKVVAKRKRGDRPNFNLNSVKQVLQNIIKQIDADIKAEAQKW